MVMISTILLQIKVFLFIMAMFAVAAGILHAVIVFALKEGKLFASERGTIIFLASLAYIITMLICGF